MYDCIVAHPFKHHAYHLAYGLHLAGLNTLLLTPFYKKGFGKLVCKLPGSVGDKARGYEISGFPLEKIKSNLYWQIFKMYTIKRDPNLIIKPYDKYVSKLILSGKIKCKTLVTLQDSMPETVLAASSLGINIWSDQISNQSNVAIKRVNTHIAKFSNCPPYFHDESINNNILNVSQIITAPSKYTYDGLEGRLPKSVKCFNLPYGVDSSKFSMPRKNEVYKNKYKIAARANTIRKGGHILIEALSFLDHDFFASNEIDLIEVNIIGSMESELIFLLKSMNLNKKIVVKSENIPHVLMPKFLNEHDFFVMPALSESMSLACIEAMCSGLPMIVTHYCGLDVFIDGEMGLVMTDTVESMHSSLVKMFKIRNTWPTISKLNREVGVSHDWNKYYEGIKSISLKL